MQPSDQPQTIPALVEAQARRTPDAIAMLAPGSKPLSYRLLYQHIEQTVATLNQLGIGRGDRVALVLPDGPVMALALLAVGSGTTALPLSPTLRREDYEYLFTKSKIRVLLIEAGSESPAKAAAEALNLQVLDVVIAPDAPAGLFSIGGVTDNPTTPPVFAQPGDIFQFLITSGTTGRPKLVPRHHEAWCTITSIWSDAFQLTVQDKYLSFVSVVYSPGFFYLICTLRTGGSVVCTSGFDAAEFFPWMEEFRPTWFMATANHFQAILAQAPFHPDVLPNSSLRFVQTGMMTMPAKTESDVETLFNIPLLQGYGATEVMGSTSSPLPPRPRKPGSVGTALGSEIAIMNTEGELIPAGEVGEVVVRGPAVLSGYEGDPEATAQAFVNGWYRMGDLGYLDEDGYLFLTGRLKEMINRGGAKIIPHEVEDVLLKHQAVAEAAVFAIPDRSLGEEIGAAVVLRPQATATEVELRLHTASRLDENKTPRRIVLVDSLPRTPSGKVQRIGLAERLGLNIPAQVVKETKYVPPTTPLEGEIAAIWADVLKRPVESIGIQYPFRELGGDSLGATRLVLAIRQRMNVPVTILDFFDAPTIADQSRVIERLKLNGTTVGASSTLIPLQPQGSRPPLFCTHAVEGGVFIYQNLLPYLHSDQPVYALQAVGMEGEQQPLERIEDIADHQVREIRSVQTKGPYFLCGYSMGTKTAVEVTRRLREQYGEVAHVFCIDGTFNRKLSRELKGLPRILQVVRHKIGTFLYVVSGLPMRYKVTYVSDKVRTAMELLHLAKERRTEQEQDPDNQRIEANFPPEIKKVLAACRRAVTAYRPVPFKWPMTYLHAKDGILNVAVMKSIYEVCTGELDVIDVPGGHGSVMLEPRVARVGEILTAWLDRLQSSPS